MAVETPAVETPPVVEPVVETPSTLPSQNQEVDYTPFELSDDIKTGMKENKINGRFGSVQEILDKLKETEDKFANDVRTNKNNESKGAEDNSIAVAKQNVGSEIEKAYIANGMEEAGGDIGACLTFTPDEYKAYSAAGGRIMGRLPNQKVKCTIEELRAAINSDKTPSWLMEKTGMTEHCLLYTSPSPRDS